MHSGPLAYRIWTGVVQPTIELQRSTLFIEGSNTEESWQILSPPPLLIPGSAFRISVVDDPEKPFFQLLEAYPRKSTMGLRIGHYCLLGVSSTAKQVLFLSTLVGGGIQG